MKTSNKIALGVVALCAFCIILVAISRGSNGRTDSSYTTQTTEITQPEPVKPTIPQRDPTPQDQYVCGNGNIITKYATKHPSKVNKLLVEGWVLFYGVSSGRHNTHQQALVRCAPANDTAKGN